MKSNTLWCVMLSFVVSVAVFLPQARAGESDQLTKVTFNQPVQIPGQVLPAGTYWFMLTGDSFNRSIVRIESLDWKTVYATQATIPTTRREPAEESIFTVAERPASQPEALLKWFYPGETMGHEFAYSRAQEREFARDQQKTVTNGPETRAGI
jgi:hypothetical protein